MSWFLEALSITIFVLFMEWSLIWQGFYQTQRVNYPGLKAGA